MSAENTIVINDKYEKVLKSLEEQKLKKHLEAGPDETKTAALLYNFLPDLFPENREVMDWVREKAR